MKVKPKILVIEDHPEVSNTIVFLLERGGCEVVAAQTGARGMELASDGQFDLITLDIDLPQINGFDVCRCLKQDPILRHTPVVFVSGRSCETDMKHGLALGAVDFIPKPFNALTFVERILSHIKPKKQESRTCLPD